MVVILERRNGAWRPHSEYPNLPDAMAALGRIAAAAGARAELVGSLLRLDGEAAFCIVLTPEWPASPEGATPARP